MFEKYLNPKQELFILLSKPTLEYLLGVNNNNDDDTIFIHYYGTEDDIDISYDNFYDIKCQTKDSEYEDRQYSIIKPTKEQETKLITLKNIGLELEEIICLLFLENKIQSFKWKSYK